MSRARHAIEKDEWDGKTAFEQFQLASRGREIYDSKVASFITRLDHITDEEKNGGFVGNGINALNFYKKEFGEMLMNFWWEAKKSQNANVFRQMIWTIEKKVATQPDWQFVAWMKVQLEQGKFPALPVQTLVKIYNEKWRQHKITGLPQTNYVQMDRICKKLNYPSPKQKRKGHEKAQK
jgi:hypothetical protein